MSWIPTGTVDPGGPQATGRESLVGAPKDHFHFPSELLWDGRLSPADRAKALGNWFAEEHQAFMNSGNPLHRHRMVAIRDALRILESTLPKRRAA